MRRRAIIELTVLVLVFEIGTVSSRKHKGVISMQGMTSNRKKEVLGHIMSMVTEANSSKTPKRSIFDGISVDVMPDEEPQKALKRFLTDWTAMHGKNEAQA